MIGIDGTVADGIARIVACIFIIALFTFFNEKYLWHYGYCTECGGEWLYQRKNIFGFLHKCSYCDKEKVFVILFKKGM